MGICGSCKVQEVQEPSQGRLTLKIVPIITQIEQVPQIRKEIMHSNDIVKNGDGNQKQKQPEEEEIQQERNIMQSCLFSFSILVQKQNSEQLHINITTDNQNPQIQHIQNKQESNQIKREMDQQIEYDQFNENQLRDSYDDSKLKIPEEQKKEKRVKTKYKKQKIIAKVIKQKNKKQKSQIKTFQPKQNLMREQFNCFKLKQLHKNTPIYTEKEKQIIQNLEDQIFENHLSMSFLKEMSLATGKSIFELLYLKGGQDMTMIQLILAYIPGYEIITYVLKEITLTEQQFLTIKIDLLRKLKPFKNNIIQIQEAIKFIKQLQQLENIQQMIQSFETNQIKKLKVTENNLTSFDKYIDLTKREQLRLLKQVNLLLFQNGFGDQFSIIYKLAKQNLDFQNLRISKTIPHGSSNINNIDKIVLQELQFNIFHQIALEKKWNLFLQYSNPYYQQPNICQITPFMIFIQKAPLKIIIEYILIYPEQLEQGIQYSTQNGLNLIHCICMNQETILKNEIDLEILISKFQQYKLYTLLIQAYNDQIPLVFYLDYQNNLSQKMIEFLSNYKKEQFNLEQQVDLQINMWQKYDNRVKQLKIYGKKYKRQEQIIYENEKLSIRFYHQYIQLAKILIKRNFIISIPWITNYGFCSLQNQPNKGIFQQTLLNIMIRNSQFEQVKVQLKQYHEFSISKNMQKYFNSSNYLADYISKLISLKKELILNPNQDINNYIHELIINTINLQPDILIKPIFYNQLKKQNNQDKIYTIYMLLLELNDTYLNNKCLNQTIQFENKWNLSIKLLEQLFQLQFINKLNDKVSQCLFQYIQKECDKHKIYNNLIQKLIVREQKRNRIDDKKLFQAIINLKNIEIINKLHENTPTFVQQFACLKQYQTDKLLRNMWLMQSKINFAKLNCQLSDFKGRVIRVQSIKPEQYEAYYDWQIQGIKFKIQNQNQIFIRNDNIKQKVITYQQQKGLQSIFLALAVYPESFNDFKNYLFQENNKQENQYFLFKNLPLKDILIQQSYQSLKLCIEMFDYSRLQLVKMLAYAYFLGKIDIYFGKGKVYDDQHIESFQRNLSKLLRFLDQNCKFYTEEMEDLKENIENAPFPHFFKYISFSIFEEFRKTISYLTHVEKFKKISIYHYIKMSNDINIRKTILQDYLNKVGFIYENSEYLLKISFLSPSLAELLLLKLEQALNSSNQDSFPKFDLFRTLQISIFQENPILVTNFLIKNELNIRPFDFQHYYLQAFQKQNFLVLNKLLYLNEKNLMQNEFKFATGILGKFLGFSLFTNMTSDLINYQNALIHPCCTALNFRQYKQYLQDNIINNQQQLTYHLLFCLNEGQFEKVEFIINQLGEFSNYNEKKLFLRLFEVVLMKYIYGKSSYHCEDYSEKEINFWLLLQKVQNFTSQKPIQSWMHQQELPCIFSKQVCETEKQILIGQNKNENKFVLFFSKGEQMCDNQKCFNLIAKWGNSETLSNLSPLFEFSSVLISPEKKQIKMSGRLLSHLNWQFQEKVLSSRMLTNIKQFMQLLLENQGQENQIFSLQQISPKYQQQFVMDLILDELIFVPTSSDLEFIIIDLQIKHEKLIPLLKQNFTGLTQLKFNQSTLYYAQKQVNLLRETSYDLEKYNGNLFKSLKGKKNRYSSHISNADVDLKKLSSTQVYLIFGQHEHICSVLEFSYENLLLALISGNIGTISYVLNKYSNPGKLAFEQNIFQLLICSSFNQFAILDLFYQFTEDIDFQNSQKLLFFNNVPLLYYIVLHNSKELFEKYYLKLVTSIFGVDSVSDFIKQQLIVRPFLDDYDILSVALKKKAYFILDYCSGVITLSHLDNVDYIDLQLIEEVSLLAFNQISMQDYFYQLFAKFLPLCKEQIFYQEYEKKINHLNYKIIKNIYVRDQPLAQILLLEKACLSQIFKLGGIYQFKNPILTIELSDNPFEALDHYKFDLNLLTKFLEKQRQKNGELKFSSEEQFSLILEKCQQNQILDHHIIGELIQSNPEKCLKIIKPFNITLFLSVFYSTYLRNSNELKEFIDKQFELNQTISKSLEQDQENEILNYNQMQPNVFYGLYLLFCIQRDEFNKFLIENMNIKTISYIYNCLNFQYQELCIVKISSKAKEFLNQIFLCTIIFEDQDQFIQIIENETTIEKAILMGILYAKSINQTIENFFNRLKSAGIEINNFTQLCKIIITNIYDQNQTIQYENLFQFTIPLQFSNNTFFIQDQQLDEFIPKLQIMNYQINIDAELEQFEQQQEQWEYFDFSSITTVDFQEIILKEKTNIIEKCIFFKHLMEPLKKVGLFDIDDVFAPHQHEQVTVLHQTNQQQQQSQHQTQSQIFQTQRILNNQKKLKQEFQFMFELLPDNTYQVRQQSYSLTQKEIIFVEFYHFIQPKVILNLDKLNEKEFKTKYDQKAVISIVIADFHRYYLLFRNLIENRPVEHWEVNFPFFIKENNFIFQESLFSTYNIQCILKKLFKYIKKVESGKKKDVGKIEWRINTISFLEVLVAKLVEIKQQLDIYSIIDEILDWDTLIFILHQILYNNLVKAKRVLKVIRGVYIEFNERSIQSVSKSNSLKGLDNIFTFGNTNYLVYNHMLIVRLNVGLIQQKLQKQDSSQIKLNCELAAFGINPKQQEYFHNIINENDFYIQIFNPDQLVQYLFNKLEIDRCLLSYSNKLSKKFHKQITLSIEHQSLVSIFQEQIINLKNEKSSEKRLKNAEQVWFILTKLNNYVQNQFFINLKDQLINENFQESINIQFFKMLQAIKENVPIHQILNQNLIKLPLEQKEQKQQILQFIKTFPCLKGQQYFGFHVEKQFYLNNFKLGDICLINQYGFFVCQLVHNKQGGRLWFLILNNDKNKIKTLKEINQKQDYYSTIEYSTNGIYVLDYERLNHIILLSSIWPSDPIFNKNILNLFYIDLCGSLYFCNEPKFMQTMNQVFAEEGDYIHDTLFDEVLGPGVISSTFDISVASFISLFPDQINFSFFQDNQMKQQKQKDYVYIHLNEEKLRIDPIPLPQISMACYFEANSQLKLIQNQLVHFVEQNDELKNIYLQFNDQLNDDPKTNIKIILENSNIFEEFQAGYERFKANQYYPQLQNSLQNLFAIQSITNLKVDFIRLNIKKIEFIYEKSYGEDNKPKIVYEQQCLKLYTVIDVDWCMAEFPQAHQITQFFYDLIIQHKKFNTLNFAEDNKNQIQIITPIKYQLIDSKIITDVILISQYLIKLIKLQDPQVQLKVIIESQDNLQENLLKHSIYQFNLDDELIINYNSFCDFNLSDFFLDFLNNKSQYQWDKYNNEIKYVGPQIIHEKMLLDSKSLLSNIEEESEIEVQMYQFGNQQFLKTLDIDPNLFQKGFLVFKVNGVYLKMTTIISCYHTSLIPYYSQVSCKQNICQSLYLLVYNLNENKDVPVQLKDIKVHVQQYANTKSIQSINLGYIIQMKGLQNQFQLKEILMTNSILLLEFFSTKTLLITLFSDKYQFSVVQQEYKSHLTLEYVTINSQDLSKTLHCQVQINDRIYLVKTQKKQTIHFSSPLIDILEAKQRDKDYKIILSSIQEEHCTEKMQTGNTINRLTETQMEIVSTAGDIRIDYLEFMDNLNNRVYNFKYSSVVFVHSLYPQVHYYPDDEREEEGLNLIWRPVIKGIYKLYIDKIQINGQFIVLASEPDLEKSLIEFPEQFGEISFYEDLTLTFLFRDRYGNLYSDIEQKAKSYSLFEIRMKKDICNIKIVYSDLNNNGNINVNLSFEPNKQETYDIEVEVDFIMNEKIKITKNLKISGLALDKRRYNFIEEIQYSFNQYIREKTVRRMNLLEDLLEWTDDAMNYKYTIRFQDEPGIDFGGLKREFYDMIGNILKDEKFKFFQPVSGTLDQYFLNSNFNKLKNKERYALLFGKLIANSIGNEELVGIDIAPAFWKVVYNQQIEFDDLQNIVDKQTFENYNGLRSLSDEVLSSLCLDFTYQVGNKTIELIPDGSKTEVKIDNLKEYLNKTAEYVIFKQFETIFTPFIEGFQSVIDINICKKWLKYTEISVLTQGLSGIKSEVLLSKITYYGGQACHKSYFETYISSADSQTLKRMLKFITGSSTIPFDQSSFVIKVEFQNNLDILKLPLAHTCFKSIEVPLYQNYAQLKQKLNIAFTIGLEAGFGFG